MIALDTNVVLRYLVQDDPGQARAATELMENTLSVANPGFISLVVLCEITWALKSVYGQEQAVIAATLRALMDAPQIEVESVTLVDAALRAKGFDVADSIIHQIGVAKGCDKTLTFDKRFARQDGVELLVA
jgi:predicted nucleic-acid-binding protein